jgi:hypothetical protein
MLLVCVPTGWLVGQHASPPIPEWGLISAVVATVVERYELGPIDDNVLITLSAAAVLLLGSVVGPIVWPTRSRAWLPPSRQLRCSLGRRGRPNNEGPISHASPVLGFAALSPTFYAEFLYSLGAWAPGNGSAFGELIVHDPV